MSKIMLVEDDNNLREIYEARLEAEGYDTVSAPDGEAALAIAAREHPDLIITDVMMPKISGFEMLDILRNTDALRAVKVIMLTALGQAEDNARANSLGADRYLVKSQVTLEDIIKAAHDVLEGPDASAAAAAADSSAVTAPAMPMPAVDPPSEPTSTSSDNDDIADEPTPESTPEPSVEPVLVYEPTAEPQISFEPLESEPEAVTDLSLPEPVTDTDAEATEPGAVPDLAEAQAAVDAAPSSSQEESDIKDQINQFIATADSNDTTEVVSENKADSLAEPAVETTAPAEANETELEKDAATPDMGELSIHTEQPEPAAELTPEAVPAASLPAEAPTALPTELPAEQLAAPASQPVAVPTPGYPSQPFVMPTAQDAAIPAAPIETPGDQLVTDALKDMAANTAENRPPLLAPSEAAPVPAASLPAEAPSFAAPAAEPAEAPAELQTEQPAVLAGEPAAEPTPTAPAAPAENPNDSSAPVAHKRVIVPLGTPSKPSIQQLLAAEDAKVAATQASQIPPAPVQADPTQSPLPQSPPPQGTLAVDPNAVSL